VKSGGLTYIITKFFVHWTGLFGGKSFGILTALIQYSTG
jgi:hypothetical protein